MTIPPPVRESLLSAAALVRLSGAMVTVDGVEIGRRQPPGPARAGLHAALSAALYSRWWAGWWPPETAGVFDAALVARLHGANAGIRGHGPSQADPANGWWTTWSARGPAPSAMARVYWNCPPETAADLVAALVAVVARAAIPYSLKCPTHPSLYGRVDALVLYVPREGWPALRAPLRAVHDRFAERLRPAVPPLALALAPGAALAEDPADGRSFGESRAEAVAEGALRAAEAPAGGGDERALACAIRALSSRGIRASHAHLRTGSPPDAFPAW